jgi:hypothetical protein
MSAQLKTRRPTRNVRTIIGQLRQTIEFLSFLLRSQRALVDLSIDDVGRLSLFVTLGACGVGRLSFDVRTKGLLMKGRCFLRSVQRIRIVRRGCLRGAQRPSVSGVRVGPVEVDGPLHQGNDYGKEEMLAVGGGVALHGLLGRLATGQ